MKKYLILFTLTLLVFNYSYSVSKIMPETDWKNKDLKGRVKTMVSTEYEYNNSGKLEKTWVTTTDFNEQGYITKEIQYVNNKLNRSTVYKNNSDGLPIKKDEVSRIYGYKYEETKDGNLLVTVKEENVDKENFSILEKITYNKNGKKVYHSAYSGKVLIRDDTYIYNEKGNLIEIKQGISPEVKDNRFPEGSIKITYAYKANGDYEKIRDTAGARWTYYYNRNGDEQEYLSVANTSSQRKPIIQLYLKFKDITRDKYGNLTTRTSVQYNYSQNKEIGIYKKIVNKYEYYK